MNLSEDHIDEFIGKYLAGEASQEEIAFVDRWLLASSDNQQYYDQLNTIFSKASKVKDLQAFDTDAAWDKMKRSLSRDETNTLIPPGSSHRGLWLKIAASVLLVSLIGIVAYQFGSKGSGSQAPFAIAADRTALADTLPDGSSVFLNKSTDLTYSYNKVSKEHVIKLKGEAYFNVNHEKDKNLVLEMDGVFIRDIGTSFNVKAYPDSNTIEVVVEEGEIKFYTATDSGVYLKEHGKAVYDKTTHTFNLDRPDVNALSYKTKQFNFDNADLKLVIQQLNAVYDKEIVLDPAMERCRLTVAFNNESLDEIAAVIAETLGGSVSILSDKILIKGNGCGAP